MTAREQLYKYLQDHKDDPSEDVQAMIKDIKAIMGWK